MKELTKEQAIALAETQFWEGMSSYEIVRFQLFENRLCMPFQVFHEAIEEELGRPVYTHEFVMNNEGLKQEFLGTKKAPTLDEIIGLIPENKRVVINLKE